jgi:hypothetical protein
MYECLTIIKLVHAYLDGELDVKKRSASRPTSKNVSGAASFIKTRRRSSTSCRLSSTHPRRSSPARASPTCSQGGGQTPTEATALGDRARPPCWRQWSSWWYSSRFRDRAFEPGSSRGK